MNQNKPKQRFSAEKPLSVMVWALALSVIMLIQTSTPASANAAPAAKGKTTDPIWTVMRDMNIPRLHQTSTLLQDGRVLVVGGQTTGNTLAAATTAEIFDPTTGTWTFTTGPIDPRGVHTATVLQDGKVLVVGGFGVGAQTAEIFDPATETWTAAGNLSHQRNFHSATLLLDGRVLVIGSLEPSGLDPLARRTTEIYDPDTNTWALGPLLPDDTPDDPDDFGRDRGHHTATLLPDGRVLITGGTFNFTIGVPSLPELRTSAYILDPTTGIWERTGDLNDIRTHHTATLLPDGRVLVTGGSNARPGFATASAELFDPATGIWTPTGDMKDARALFTATLLPNGRVLAAGGLDALAIADGRPIAGAEIFNPQSGTWNPISDLNFPHSNHAATLLSDGRLLVSGSGGGGTPLDPGPASAAVELFDPAMPNWMVAADLNTRRQNHTATLLPNGRVLVAGGKGKAAGNSAEVFDPAIGSWAATGNLNTRRQDHTATLLTNGQVLVAGGKGGYGDYDGNPASKSAELFDPATSSWTGTGNLNAHRQSHTATLLSDGQVLVAGGKGKTAGNSAEVFDPNTGSWNTTGKLNTRRQNHTATLLADGWVLVAGGMGKAAGRSAELFNPATGSWIATGKMNVRRHGHTATLLPNGQVLVAGSKGYAAGRTAELFDPATGRWTLTDKLNSHRGGHTATLLADGRVLVVSGGRGRDTRNRSEVFDPATDSWTATGNNLNTRWQDHTATLLADGRVLVTGGSKGKYARSRTELCDRGLGYMEAWRPVLTSATSPLFLDEPLLIEGEQFRGLSEASGANSGQSSPTDYPLVQLRRVDNEQMHFLLADSWSETAFTSVPLTDFPAGHAIVTVFTNGIPSISKIIWIP